MPNGIAENATARLRLITIFISPVLESFVLARQLQSTSRQSTLLLYAARRPEHGSDLNHLVSR
jgi:hypothetical protein